MSLLLDTCTFIWLAAKPNAISKEAHRVLEQSEEVFVSAVSSIEIANKVAVGKLRFAKPAEELIPEIRAAHGLLELPLYEADALRLARLPFLHRDPFDRLLVCQALVRGLTIVTPDALITQYPVNCLW